VSPAEAAVLSVGVLALGGVLPVLALVGPRVFAVPLCPLAGAVLAGLAAITCVMFAGTLLTWFVLWAIAAAAVSVAVFWRRPDQRLELRRTLRQEARPLPLVGGAVVVAAVAWSLRTLRIPNVGFDTRAIWLVHAHWLRQGHEVALAALRNPFLVVTHPSYPPLLSSVMALAWRVSGNGSDRVAVMVVALLNGCALFVAGWGVVEAARLGGTHLFAERPRRRHLLAAIGIVLAVLVVLVAGGVLGTFATNGYADPLWSLSAVAAVLFGLVVEPRASDLGVVAIMLGVTGLTKVEGTAVAIVLVLSIGLRHLLRQDGPDWRSGLRPIGRYVRQHRRPLLVMAGAVVALSAWEVVVQIIGVPPDASTTGRGEGSLASRVSGTWDGAAPHLHVVGLALVCAVAGAVLLGPLRRRLGLGNDLWGWATLAAAALVLGGAYVFGPGNLDLWLATSVNRTTIFVALLGWWIVAVWALCGSAGVLE
jgi:hypothetical protein